MRRDSIVPDPHTGKLPLPKRPRRPASEVQLWRIGLVILVPILGIFFWSFSSGLISVGFVLSNLVVLALAIAIVAGIIESVSRNRVRELLDQHDGMVCPLCHFSLHGLPAAGTCPECSVVYTRPRVIDIWERAYRLVGRYEKLLPAPPPAAVDLTGNPVKKEAPWSSWSLIAALQQIESVGRRHGFSGAKLQTFYQDFQSLNESQTRSLPTDLFHLLGWIDCDMWAEFVKTNCLEGETVGGDNVASFDVLWEEGETDAGVNSPARLPITLVGPTELRAEKLSSLSEKCPHAQAFSKNLERLERSDDWNVAQFVEFASTRDGARLYIVTGATDLHRGGVIAFLPETTDRVWLADSLSQWLIRLADCDGMEPGLFPHTIEKLPIDLRTFWESEFRKHNPHFQAAS